MSDNVNVKTRNYQEPLLKSSSWKSADGEDSDARSTDGVYGASSFVTNSGLKLNANQAECLKEGAILLAHMGKCYQLDLSTKKVTFLFELVRNPHTYLWATVPDQYGNVYCSVSGSTEKNDLYLRQGAKFGSDFGCIVRVDSGNRRLDVIVEETVIDPWGMELLNDHQLLFADMVGWGGGEDGERIPGSVKVIDVRSGAFEVLAEGNELIDPHMATLDSDGVLWIANAMHQQYDGSLVRVDPEGKQTMVVPRHGPGSGILCGLFGSSSDQEVIFVTIDWPYMHKSSVCAMDKKTGKVEVLLSASRKSPKVFAMHGAVDPRGIMWIPESYEGELIGYDLKARKVTDVIDISGVTGQALGPSIRGVYDSFTFCEGAYIVPEQLNDREASLAEN